MFDYKFIEFKDRFNKCLEQLDYILEEKYGALYNLHPNRPKHKETSNSLMDGLFELSAGFSAGYGSEHGSGFVLRVRMATLEHIETSVQKNIEEFSVSKLEVLLESEFPNKKIKIVKDGEIYKIIGEYIN